MPATVSLEAEVFSQELIAARVQELGREIDAHYSSGELLVLGLLKGSFIFLGDLVRNIPRPLQVDFLVASSYGAGTTSSGEVRLVYDPETLLEGKHILLVEDIVDSGITLNNMVGAGREQYFDVTYSTFTAEVERGNVERAEITSGKFVQGAFRAPV